MKPTANAFVSLALAVAPFGVAPQASASMSTITAVRSLLDASKADVRRLIEKSAVVVTARVVDAEIELAPPDPGPIPCPESEAVLADGTTCAFIVSGSPPRHGRVVRFEVESVHKSDGSLSGGRAFDVYFSTLYDVVQGSPGFQPGDRWLLFLARMGQREAGAEQLVLRRGVVEEPFDSSVTYIDLPATLVGRPSREVVLATRVKLTDASDKRVRDIARFVGSEMRRAARRYGP